MPFRIPNCSTPNEYQNGLNPIIYIERNFMHSLLILMLAIYIALRKVDAY